MLPALALLALSAPAEAASYDPDLTWRTLSTEHFNITFHGGLEQLAEELGHTAEVVWTEMTTELAWEPRRKTEVVLVDHTDSANGYATTLPVNTIVIYVTAPEADSTLALYEDWNDAIFTHEFTHILHLDTVEGIPRLVRAVLGRIISVNQVSPGWIVEGQATFQETRHTPGGRGRSTIADMIKRVTILEGEFPPLGNLEGFQTDPPYGNLRYLFGQDFMQYIADRTGEMVWTDWNHTYGSWIPYWLPSRRVFGQSLTSLYYDWRDDATARYQAQRAAVEAEGITAARLLSDGEDHCAGGTFSPDGRKIVWSCSDPRRGSNVYLAKGDGSDPDVEIEATFAGDFTWRADSGAFAYSVLHTVDRFNLYSDVYLHKVKGATEALTSGRRARQPAFSPGGEHLLVVTNEAQNNNLARLTVDRRVAKLTDNADHTQYDSPRYSPDGRFIGVSVWERGQRDLWLLTPEGEKARRLTEDAASDIQPWWSADGRTLYFASDRTGIYNIYAIDLDTERLWQVTNVLGGAFRPVPSPAGDALVFESYGANGGNIAWMALDRAQWRDRGLLPQPLERRLPLAEALPREPIPPPPPPEESEVEPEKKPKKSKEKDKDPQEPLPLEGRMPLPVERYEDPEPLPGLTGLGGPFQALYRQPGPWGLPGEKPAIGEYSLGDQPTEGPDIQVEDKTSRSAPDESDYPFTFPVHRYNPLPTLLPPRFVSPGIYQTAFGFQGTLSTAGVDLLRRYLYSAFVSYRTDSRYVGWGASFAYNQLVPVISGGFYTYTVPYGDVFVYPGPPDEGGSWIPTIESANLRYWDERKRGYATVTWPLDSQRTVFVGWSGTYRSPWLVPDESRGIERGEALPSDVYYDALPDRGFFSTVSAGWYKGKGTSYLKSVSPEEARILTVVGSVSSPWIGSYTLEGESTRVGFTQVQGTGEWREYRTVPWPERWERLQNHVIAWKLAGGLSAGDSQRYGSFRLGGSFGEGAYSTLPDEWRSLRGFPVATVYGDSYYVGSAEYRLPIAWIDRGFGTLPFFARYLAAAVFVDAGYAFNDLETELSLASTLVGAGAELRGSAVVGWGIPLTGRLGYAFALNGAGYALGDLGGLYLWLGTSF